MCREKLLPQAYQPIQWSRLRLQQRDAGENQRTSRALHKAEVTRVWLFFKEAHTVLIILNHCTRWLGSRQCNRCYISNKMHVTIKRHFHVTESFINWSIRLISLRTSFTLCCTNGVLHQSQWPRGIKQGSSVLRLLGLRLWIPPGTWMSVSCKFCVFSSRGLCVGLIFRPEESYRVSCVRMWSWKLENTKVVAHPGLSHHGGWGE